MVSVSEVSHSRQYHRQSMFIGGGDDLRVANRAARLDDTRSPCPSRLIQAIPEGEEGVRGHGAALEGRPTPGSGNFYRIHPACLPATRRQEPIPRGKDDGIALDMLTHLPGKA